MTGYRLTARDSDTYMLDVNAYVESLDDQGTVPSTDSRTQRVRHALAQDGYDELLAYLDHWADTCATDPGQDSAVWFDVGPLNAPDIIHPYWIHRDIRIAENTDDLIPTNCANGIDVKPGVDTDALLGYLNSTVHAAFLELWGQAEGGGSLEVTTGTLNQLPVADGQAFSEETRNEIGAAYHAFIRDEDNAQARLDNAILDALDAEVDAATLREAHEMLRHDRFPND